MNKAVSKYLNRFAWSDPDARQWGKPHPDVDVILVIPAMAERDSLPEALASVAEGLTFAHRIEVIVVVNHPPDASEEVRRNNEETLEWLRHSCWPFPLWVVDKATGNQGVQDGHFGVGAARRLGMDLALSRLQETRAAGRGLIASLDADSPVARGYVDSLRNAFEATRWKGAVCRYRHRLPEETTQADAIACYEAWCRYVELGLHAAGSPYAYQTLGSCMVVRADAYCEVRGMPLRQAGEDFYFLQKLAKVQPGTMGWIGTTTVFPSPRASTRVPFGTGPAVAHCLASGLDRYAYVIPPEAFWHVRDLIRMLPDLFVSSAPLETLAPPLQEALRERRAAIQLEKIRRNARDVPSFVQRFHGWFDGLATLRYLRSHPAVEIGAAIVELAVDQHREPPPAATTRGILAWLRNEEDQRRKRHPTRG